jgi:hypothetical protein
MFPTIFTTTLREHDAPVPQVAIKWLILLGRVDYYQCFFDDILEKFRKLKPA